MPVIEDVDGAGDQAADVSRKLFGTLGDVGAEQRQPPEQRGGVNDVEPFGGPARADRVVIQREGRIDLFTGKGSSSMAPMMHLNLATLTVSKVGEFSGCPSLNPTGAARLVEEI